MLLDSENLRPANRKSAIFLDRDSVNNRESLLESVVDSLPIRLLATERRALLGLAILPSNARCSERPATVIVNEPDRHG